MITVGIPLITMIPTAIGAIIRATTAIMADIITVITTTITDPFTIITISVTDAELMCVADEISTGTSATEIT